MSHFLPHPPCKLQMEKDSPSWVSGIGVTWDTRELNVGSRLSKPSSDYHPPWHVKKLSGNPSVQRKEQGALRPDMTGLGSWHRGDICFCPKGVWILSIEDITEMMDAYAKQCANNISSTLGPIVNPCFQKDYYLLFLLNGRNYFLISYLTAKKKSLKITFLPFLWIFKIWSIFMFPKEENSIAQSGIWLIFFVMNSRVNLDRVFISPLCFMWLRKMQCWKFGLDGVSRMKLGKVLPG